MKFYHGTSFKNWGKIKTEGVLWGYRIHNGIPTLDYRYTYLTPDIEIAKKYGNNEILLEVEYNPVGPNPNKKAIDNYGFNPPPGQTCWQFSVFISIDLKYVKKLDILDWQISN